MPREHNQTEPFSPSSVGFDRQTMQGVRKGSHAPDHTPAAAAAGGRRARAETNPSSMDDAAPKRRRDSPRPDKPSQPDPETGGADDYSDVRPDNFPDEFPWAIGTPSAGLSIIGSQIGLGGCSNC